MTTKSMLNTAPSGIVTTIPIVDQVKSPLKKKAPVSPAAVASPKAPKGKAAVKKAPMGQCAYCKYDIYRHGSQHKVDGKPTWFHDGCYPRFQEREARKLEKAKATEKTL